MKIGILLTGPLPPDMEAVHGNYSALFGRLLDGNGFTFETWRVTEGDFPEAPEQADGWLITGSRHGVYEDHAWIAPLEALIRDIVAVERPLVGVCFGHQIVAQALGGHVEKFEGGWSIGPKEYDFPAGPRLVHAWHQDQVIRPPEGAETVASNGFTRHAALLYPGKAYTVQPHPEFDDAFVTDLIVTRGPGVVPDTQLSAAAARLGSPLDRADFAADFARFFRERRLS